MLAGPAASLLSAGVVILLPFPKGFFSELFVLISLLIGARELLPRRHRIAVSDGARILMLLRDRAEGRRWLALVELEGEIDEGVLPESWPRDRLAAAVAVRDDSADTLSAHALAYSAAFHRRDDGEAARFLEACLRHSNRATPFVREALKSDAAVFQARRRGRPDLAQAWLDAMAQPERSPWLRARAEAAILETRGDRDGALERLDSVEKVFRAQPDTGRRKLFLRLLERWRSEVRGG